MPEGATAITKKGKITAPGNYVVSTAISGKINVQCAGVHIYLNGATVIAEDDKAITSKNGLTITVLGENTVKSTATGTDTKNAIDCDGDLVINGSGALAVTSTKNGIAANSIAIKDATVTVDAAKDGLHAEIGEYDDNTSAPEFSYADGGFVYIDGASITVDAESDGIQADTFVYVTGESALDIKANGGAPSSITEASAAAADGKGIKAGAIDWGANDTELDGKYLIMIDGGEISVDSNDDALHCDGQVLISGGTVALKSGDDGVHAGKLLKVSGGEITVAKSYEGIESAKIEISGGKFDVIAVDDGINAADDSNVHTGTFNSNCHVIVSGGELYVNAGGDGIDSNGTMLFTGGKTFVAGPTANNNAALDSDGGIIINGGYVFAVGSLGMVETPASNSAQNVVSFAYSSAIAADTVLSLTNSSGEVLLYFQTPKACRSVIISCPELTSGNSYAIYGGDGKLADFTVSSTITTVGSSAGMGTPGGAPGGGFGGKPGRR